MPETAATGSAVEAVAGAPPDRPAAWVQGIHGVLVGFEDISPQALRRLALSHRSTGLGPLEALVELPGSGEPRGVPRSAAGDRAPTAGGAPPRVPEPRSPESGAPRSLPAGAIPPVPRAPADQDEQLDALLERSLAEARYLLLPNRARSYAVAKRIVDLVGASLLLLLAGPVMLVLAVLIRLDSPGPAIFAQTRVTRGGRTFRFLKFRTMYTDARDRFPQLYDYRLSGDQFESAYYKLADDPRNTRVGRWLRRTTLDELPNLFNVLTGDLSLVGPRPDLPEFVRLYRPEEMCLLFTKAGLTGVAQVAGRSLLTVRERLTLDMRYVAHQTLLLDLRILWRTVVVVLSGRGAF